MPCLDEKTSRFLFTVLLALVGYFCIAWSVHYLIFFKNFQIADVYYLPSFILMGVSFFSVLYKEKKICFIPELEKREWMALVLIVISFIISRMLKVDEMRIWLDEYTQFLYGMQAKEISAVEASFYEQQPPLDYILSGVAGIVFKVTPFALKFHVLFFSFLFYLLLPFCFRLFTSRVLPRYGLVLVLLFCRPLMVFSLEARPLMLSTLFSLLSTTFVFNLLNSKDKSSYFAAIFSCFIYTTTTGLQPQVFLLILCGGLSIIKSEGNHSPFKVGLFTFLYNIPTLYFLVKYTRETNQFNGEFFDKLNLLFSEKEFSKVLSIITWDPYLIVCPLLLFGSCLFFKVLKEKNKERRKLDLFILLFPFLYIGLYVVLYYSAISWWFSPRYTLNVYSSFAFLFLLGAIEVFSLEVNILKRAMTSALVFLLVFGTYRVLGHPFKWYVESAHRTDWKGLYDELNRKVNPTDKILMFTMTNIGNWRGILFVGEAFYPNKVVKKNTLKNSFEHREINTSVFCDDQYDYLEKSKGRLYLINDPTRLSLPVSSIKVEGVNIRLEKKFEFMELYSIPIQENIYSTVKNYFDLLIERYKGAEALTPLIESLFCLELKYGNKEEFQKYLSLYKKTDLKQSWSKSGLYYDKSKELKGRLSYFEMKMDERWK